MTPVQAAYRGAKEIGFTVLSMSVSLVAVFIPILLMGGIVGRLFREFAVVLSIAITVSLLVSLTTTPTMCAKFLRPIEEKKHGRFYRASEWFFNRLLKGYDHSLRWVLRHQVLTLVVTIATACLSVYLYIIVPKGFFPQQDTGRVVGSVQASQDISFAAMKTQDDPIRRHGHERPSGEHRRGVCRWEYDIQQWPHVHHVEAVERAESQRGSGNRAAAAQSSRLFPVQRCICSQRKI